MIYLSSVACWIVTVWVVCLFGFALYCWLVVMDDCGVYYLIALLVLISLYFVLLVLLIYWCLNCIYLFEVCGFVFVRCLWFVAWGDLRVCCYCLFRAAGLFDLLLA